MKQPRFVTTSWDDGDPADLKLAELLRSKGLQGTFYIPIEYQGRLVEHSGLRTLGSAGFEIGAHGFSHKLLWGLRPQELASEVRACKRILEDILGMQVEMFCYPCGRYDVNVIRALQKAGYKGARTVRMLATRPTFNPFEMPTTLQAFPHAQFAYLKNVARAQKLGSLRALVVHVPWQRSWVELGMKLFDEVLESGGIWHLFGHSWEVEKLGLWDDLCEILDYVGGRTGVSYVPNGSLVTTALGAIRSVIPVDSM